MIVMDRENLYAPGWSHVVSTRDDLAELEAFRIRVGAPPPALQLGNPRWPHLDLRDAPREAALADPGVRIFSRTADLVRFVRGVQRARRLLRDARRAVVLTGAGISAESGVPTFRGSEGLWRSVRPEEIATPEAFAADPRRSWEWYGWRRDRLAACRPNPAHLALAQWLLDGPERTLVTQNVDGLHELAALEAAGGRTPGAAMPLRLHGSIFHVRCTRCGHRAPHREPVDASSAATLPVCPVCGALLRPDVVWFGEALPVRELELAFEAARRAEVCLVVGTQGLVHPAAGVADEAARGGAELVVVDPGATAWDAAPAIRFRERAALLLPELLAPPAAD